MRRFRAIVAILMLVLTMPLAHAHAVISSSAAYQRDCCKQKPDACCEGSAKACCATQTPAAPSPLPSQNVSPLLLPPRTVPVVHPDRADILTLHCAAVRLPAEHSPPGLIIVATTLLRI
jgi:hypothetical protein